MLAAAYRNPALTAKLASTIDVISNGRFEIGIGAGWKEDEWLAYGYGFPDAKTRLAILRDHLEVISRMLAPGRATYRGQHAHVLDAVHEPKGAHGPVPILVGGNGPNVTWRLAARFADELNLDGTDPAAVAEALPVIRARCEEIGRDPATLKVSVHTWYTEPGVSDHGQARVDLFGAYRDLGLSRVQSYVDGLADGTEALESFAEDLRAAGIALENR